MSSTHPNTSYTLAWICALPEEYEVAIAILDEIHGIPQHQPLEDKNAYLLGRIGQHHVVMVCLPAGRMGTAAAASVAENLCRTFQSVRYGLLVGIGGGVPGVVSGKDIRLGDVGVSVPGGRNGGVVQYDLEDGEVYQGQLNSPPEKLLSYVTLLNILMRSPRISGNCFREQLELLGQEYEYPAHLEDRNKRKDTLPAVHLGMIASGNTVVGDGVTRDMINHRYGNSILCFEMEAAGIMNALPCLVVRGISDYADSRKNDEWRPRAIAAACSYAKALILHIPREEMPQHENLVHVTDLVKDMRDELGQIMAAIAGLCHLQKSDEYTKSHTVYHRLKTLASRSLLAIYPLKVRSSLGIDFLSRTWFINRSTDKAVDTAASTGVSKRILTYSWLQLIAAVLVSITGIVTPLGLYDTIGPQDNPTDVLFHYAPDTSAFGKATPSRDGYKSLRICYADEDPDTPEGCPGAPPNRADMEDITEAYSVWPSSVNLFTSGNVSATVSSVFDVQWRSFRSSTQIVPGASPTGSVFSQGYYRQISQLILDEDLLAVEGLIVDSKAGRIGFRNHTIPSTLPMGAEWTEDILFIEPETRCVDTNLTVDYNYDPQAQYSSYSTDDIYNTDLRNLALVDRGGFVNLSHERYSIDASNFQEDAALYERAYNAAWRHNMLIMQYFNVTTNGSDGRAPFAYMHSEMGKRFSLANMSSIIVEPMTVQTDSGYGSFLDVPDGFTLSGNFSSGQPENPLNLSTYDVYAIGREACHYPSDKALSNMSFVGVACGTVFAAPRRLDGDSLIPDTNSTWSTPLYSCAAATKAAVREVTFRFNGTGGLDKLVIQSINEKKYNDPSELPLWGVERLKNHTLQNVRPLWGLVSPEVGARDDISTVQRDYLWLPGYPDLITSDTIAGEPSMPGNLFYTQRLLSLFDIATLNQATSRYTGSGDLALYNRWFELSSSASGVEKMLGLIWTDMTANTVVGTRGWHNAPSQTSNNSKRMSKRDVGGVSVPVTLWSRNIKYHIPYAIPAFIVLALSIALAGFTICLLILRRTGLGQMRSYLARTSPGRILGSALHPDQAGVLASTKTWIQQVGVRKATLPGKKEDGTIPLLDIPAAGEEGVRDRK
ncbi:hypothetical protein CBS147346_1983 [Aspergillus niger]|nr:hypothetical protein CBS147346_1983 [Aspergillus niger]